jgi:hypothetical protein
MKRLVKHLLKAAWTSTEPIRAPIVRKLENFLRRALQPMESGLLNETDVLMDHVIRELVRLQCRVEALQQILVDYIATEGQGQGHEPPAIAGEIEPAPANTSDEQLKAG